MKLVIELNKIIYEDENCVEAHLVRGDLYYDLDSIAQAKQDFFTVLNFDEKNTYALYQLGNLFNTIGDENNAIKFFKRAINTKEGPGSTIILDYHTLNNNLSTNFDRYDVPYDEILYQMAKSYYYARNLNTSLQLYNSCINSNYKLKDVFFFKGAIFFEMGKKDSACKYFTMAKDLRNTDAEIYLKKYCY